jgi:copper(I)-binding protein
MLLAIACRRAEVGASATAGDVTVRRAVAWTMSEARSATAGFELDVAGAGDTLLGVASSAGRAGLHATKGATGAGMQAIASLPLAPGRTMVDGTVVHVMVQDMPADIPIGGTLPLELRFARAGTVQVDLPVLNFSDALTALGR